MKTITLLTAILRSNTSSILFRSYITPLIFAIITLTSCSKDDDDLSGADIAKLVGTYSVTDTDENGDIENYSISVSKSKDGGVEISNFGDIMYVPVKGSINGNMFTIPSQTFKGKSMTIIISGHGTLNGDKLNFDYVIETGSYLLEHSCVANKNI